MDEKSLVKYTRTILMQCIGTDQYLIQEIANALKREGAISATQYENVCSNLENGYPEEAAGSLPESAYGASKAEWKKNLIAAIAVLHREESLKELLSRLFSVRALSPEMTYLIKSCNKMSSIRHALVWHENKAWPRDELKAYNSHRRGWITELLLKCIKDDGQQNMEEFIEKVKELLNENIGPETSNTANSSKGYATGSNEAAGAASSAVRPEFKLPQAQKAEDFKSKHSSDSSNEVEFRVVIAGSSSLRFTNVCIATDVYGGWSTVQMQKMACEGIFNCSIPIPKSCRSFECKYYLVMSTGQQRWEEFPFAGRPNTNRVLHNENLTGGSILHDVAVFPSEYSRGKQWDVVCQEYMQRHLAIAAHFVSQPNETAFSKNVFSWLRSIKRGWNLTNAYSTHFTVPLKDMQDQLLQWLRRVVAGVQNDSGNTQVILTTLTVVVGLHSMKITVLLKDLLHQLFQLLSVHELSQDQQNSLRMDIMQRNRYSGMNESVVQDSILSLLNQLIEFPMPEFLLVLPLYWIILGEDASTKDLAEVQAHESFLAQRSGLPRALKSSRIQHKFYNSQVQRGLLNIAPAIERIAKLHPLIIGSYQFFLEDRSLIELIKNWKWNSICSLFPLDSVLYQLINACKVHRPGGTNTSDLVQLNDYFKTAFQTLIVKAGTKLKDDSNDAQNEMPWMKFDAPKNIISWVSTLLADIVKKSPGGYDTVKTISRDIMWCLDIACLSTKLAIVSAGSALQLEITWLKESMIAISSLVSSWIHRCKMDQKQLEFCNSVATVEWPDESLRVKWRENMRTEIKDKITKTWQHEDDEKFLNFFAVTLESTKLEETVETCLSEKAFLCTANILSKYTFESSKKEQGHRSYASAVFSNIKSWVRKPSFISIFDRLFQREFDKAATTYPNRSRMQALSVLLSWSFALQFYDLFYHNEPLSKFSKNTKDKIVTVAEMFGEIIQSLKSGKIIVMQLKLIVQNQEKFLDLCGCIKIPQLTTDFSRASFSSLIDGRQAQLTRYEIATEHIRDFLHACSKLDEGGEVMVKTSELKAKLRDSANVADEVLSEISPDQENSSSSTSFLNLKAEILKKFEEISFVKDSKVFHETLHQTALQAKASAPSGFDLGDSGLWHVSWREVVGQIWKDTHDDIMNLVQEIDLGTMTVDTAKEWFQRCTGDPNEIKKEVKLLYDYYAKITGVKCGVPEEVSQENEPSDQLRSRRDSDEETDDEQSDDDDEDEDSVPSEVDLDSEYSDYDDEEESYDPVSYMELRANQFASFFLLEKAEHTIDIMLEIKDVFELTGEFSGIEKLKESVYNKSVTLDELPADVDVPLVCKIPQNDVECLRCFIKEKELILWLKERTNNIADVQAMCDVALTSAGETPYEVDIVSCLLGAVMGFAPLIYDLGDHDGFEDLLAKCKTVWENRDRDEKLLQKWSDSGKQLTWFKGIDNVQGSVEKQSLTLVREINKRGVYLIEGSNLGGAVSYKECVRLTVSNEDNDGARDTYDLDALFDLQCKLMLIAGETETGWKEVAKFVEILNIVHVLAETFVKLVRAGCMLFNRWSACIRCNDVNSRTSDVLVLEIKFGEDCPPLNGTGSIAELNKLSGILSESFDRWKEYVDAMRMKYYFLNTYSMQQIIYLCHELATNKMNLPDQVNILLSFVGEYSSVDDLQNKLEEATKVEETGNVDQEQDSNNDETGGVESMEDKLKVVRRLMDEESIEEDLAKAAVQATGCKDIGECANWVLLYQFDTDEVEHHLEEFNKESGQIHQQSEERKVVSVLYNRSTNTLEEVISRLQNRKSSVNIMDSVAAICEGYHDETTTITLQDSLSIEHLGRFLEIINNGYSQQPQRADIRRLKTESNETAKVIERNLKEPFVKGQPNLLLCHEQEVLPSVLYLYMLDEDQPLPTVFEVLLCSEKTTTDEVERFMRRAICNSKAKSRLLFTLAFADKLDFNVSSATEKIYNKLSSEVKNDDYQLVILLSKPQHYLTTCFDKFLIEGKWMTSHLNIASYLTKNLKLPDDGVKTSAACAEKDHSNVKVVSSMQSGVGKSLHVKRIHEKLTGIFRPFHKTTIRLLERSIDIDFFVERLLRPFSGKTSIKKPLLVHIDLTPSVHAGIEEFAFNLFVLGSIQNSQGYVWKRHPNHLYMIEVTFGDHLQRERFSPHHILKHLPCIQCVSPKKILEHSENDESSEWIGMDKREFLSETYQRPYQYLHMYDAQQSWHALDSFRYTKPSGTPEECMNVLLKHCCMANPSWAQLRHFASFLNVQLLNCENSVFCDRNTAGEELRGLKAFAVKFMVRMSQDFATPSLVISDESSARPDAEDLSVYQFRRKWEESTHPYMFFNEDRATMTFINVNISEQGDLLDKNGEVVESQIISPQLVQGLKLQQVSLDLNFDTFSRKKKLEALCQVMGIQHTFDPDPTYELTTDNVLKILAVYMRFRCQIPVIIMGETGCGKTRMVEFISKLKAGKRQSNVRSMVTLKIHGGITVQDIYKSVKNACTISADNESHNHFGTILFYDEANTTEAIYALKEVMCDITVDGESFQNSNLKLVAACNPYKQLSKEAIRKLEDSGLGYRIKTCDTTHLFGNVPIRTLVYRVVALPPSMQPFVWDFGQLSDAAERIYIQQMTKKLGRKLELDQKTMVLINTILFEAQSYMRSRQDECRYVSLRDVERCVIAYEWFHRHRHDVYHEIEREVQRRFNRMNQIPPDTSDELRTLLQTIGVCYHASLGNRRRFREKMSEAFGLEGVFVAENQIQEEISASQAVFLEKMKLDDNIAANEALQENVFMMMVCADMRIPLFLIGKPGTSKSLAKTIVGDNMRGALSHSNLCKKLKQIHILSYQCSALTDAAGIETVFKQCAQLQAKQDLNAYTAVVVLDEIGLAEDSPNMPLKVLHPLLEGSGTGDNGISVFDPAKKVGFIGISNWALDPAKMNRGIFVTRSKPSKDDLKKTAKGIFRNQKNRINENLELLEKLTESYMRIYEGQEVEYFGLRDYYGLIKMLHGKCSSISTSLTAEDVTTAIHRNFSGGKMSFFDIFKQNIQHLYREILSPTVPLRKVISDNLSEKESRYMLLLTNQFSASSLLQLCIKNSESQVQIIFGSSFPGDHQYSDICRNINRIKAYMETGKSVVLLNMTEIHESLYDALNQHYVSFGGQRYVDLGLGGHRVKCRIAQSFRLIVVEQKEVVYTQYPIPLINRLEKHHLDSRSLLSDEQMFSATTLETWAEKFYHVSSCDFKAKDAFMGYHSDTVYSVILATETLDETIHRKVLLESASMDAIFRLQESQIGGQSEEIQMLYLQGQCHDSLISLLKESATANTTNSLIEVVSYSNVLSENDRQQIETQLGSDSTVMLLSLEQFQTEKGYADKLEEFFNFNCDGLKVLLVQCAQAQNRSQLVECAKFCLKNKMKEKEMDQNTIVAILLSTEREGEGPVALTSLSLQHAADNRIVYIDEMRLTKSSIPPASSFYKKSLCDILRSCAMQLVKNEVTLVDITSLLKDCVCDSVARVKSKFNESRRYLDRIKILSDIFCGKLEISSSFQKIMLEKIIQLYSEKEEQALLLKDWTVSEACNRESLQEGGTFCKTLWLSLKNRLSRLIAYMLSIGDRQHNMNHLLHENKGDGWKVDMWMKIFKELEVTWNAIGGAQEFIIHEPSHHKRTIPCLVPFSFQLHRFLLDQWNGLAQQNSPNMQKLFLMLYRKSKLSEIVAQATAVPKSRKFVELYTSDLVRYLYSSGSGNNIETNMVIKIIVALSLERFRLWREEGDLKDGDECAIVFICFKEMSKNLSVFSDILHAFPQLLSNREWVEGVEKSMDKCNIHIQTFKKLLEILESNAEGLENPETCLKWKLETLVSKKLFKKLINNVENSTDKAALQDKWTRVELLQLLLGHLLPDDDQKESFQHYLPIISSQATLVWRFVSKRSVSSFDAVKFISKILQKTYDKLKLQLLIGWQDPSCSLCRKVMVNPSRLPCGHCNCDDCIRKLVLVASNVKRCPKCSTEIPNNQSVQRAQLGEKEENEMAQFMSNCTSFFMEYLDIFCFSSPEKIDQETKQKYVNALICQFILETQAAKEDEIELSAIDLNINSKTCILRILLDTYPEMTKEILNEQLPKVATKEMENVICVILKCFEDQVRLNMSNVTGGRVDVLNHWLTLLCSSTKKLFSLGQEDISVTLLQLVAEVRCCLTEAAHCINDIFKKKELADDVTAKADNFVAYAVRICANDDIGSALQEFIVRAAFHLFGSDWFHQLKTNQFLEELVPISLMQAMDNDKIDRWSLLGNSYSEEYSKIFKAAKTKHHDLLQNTLRKGNDIGNLARILAHLTSAYDMNEEEKQAILDIIISHTDSRIPVFGFIHKLHSDFIPALRSANVLSSPQIYSVYQLVTVIVAMVTNGNQMMENFNRLLTRPSSVENLFLPGMPENAIFSIPEEMRDRNNSMMYTCPNGHLYAVGECRRPMQEARCPDCSAVIGGVNHRPAAGNERFQLKDEISQAGYLLSQQSGAVIHAADRISKQGAAVIQFLLHACMLASVENEPETIMRMVHKNSKKLAQEYLIKQLRDNLSTFSDALGRNTDDTILILYDIILKLMEKRQGQQSPTWTSMASRKQWEIAFREEYLTPVFQNLDQIVSEAEKTINNAEDQRCLALHRLVHEVETTGKAGKSEFSWSDPILWMYIKQSDSSHLLQVLEDNWDVENSILKIIIESPDLSLVKYLESVLLLQAVLIEKYQNETDLDDTERITLKNFEADGGHSCRKLMDDYILIWNKLYHKMRVLYSHAHKRIIEYLEPISIHSPISVALPSLRGRGLCAKLLAEHLIELQNDFLVKCKQVMKSDDTIHDAKVSQLYHSDFVCVDMHCDLLPLIRMHTKYDVNRDWHGRHHHISYNINALEKQVRESFAMYKKQILKQSLPLMQYPQDVGIGNEWDKVIENTPQVPLPGRVAQDVDQSVSAVTSADVCEGVRTLAQAISFLAKVKTDGKRNVVEFLEKDLMLPLSCMSIIPKSAQIEHTLSLYNHLSWHKAVRFTSRGLNPYKDALSTGEQKMITGKRLLDEVNQAFEHTDVIVLQLKLNEMLIKKPDFSADWSLKDIFPYFDFIGDNGDDDSWYERLPDDILFMHACHLFTLSVHWNSTR